MPLLTPAFSCDLNTLKKSGACLFNLCLGEQDLLALDMWVRIQTLQAVGGADYRTNTNQLLVDSKQWQGLAEIERKALSLLIDILYGVEEGAAISESSIRLAAVLKEVSCYRCLGQDRLKDTLLFLKCSIAAIEEQS